MTAQNTQPNALFYEAGFGCYQVSLPSGGVGLYFAETARDNITANPGGGQANAFLLPCMLNRITVVATPGDSVKLPPAMPGTDIMVFNDAANPMAVFPSTGDFIDNAAANVSVTQMGNS